MRWKAPKHLDTRARVRFAFFPVKCRDGKGDYVTVWLERYIHNEEYFAYSLVGQCGWQHKVEKQKVLSR